MWLALTLKNIKNFVKTKSLLFFFIIISQIVCIIATFAVAGMVDAVTPEPEDNRTYTQKTFFISFNPYKGSEESPYVDFVEIFDDDENRFVYLGFDKEEIYKVREKYPTHHWSINSSPVYINIDNLHTFKDIKSKINDILKVADNKLLSYDISGYIDDTQSTYFNAEDGDDEWMQQYSSEIYQEGNNIVITRNPYADTPYKNLKEGDKIKIGNTEYNISKIKERNGVPPDSTTSLLFRYSSIDDDFKVSSISLTIKDTTDQNSIAKIKKAIDETFSDDQPEIDVPEPQPLLEKQFNNMIYVLSFIMIAVVILNISRLYTFIMSTRKKFLAVFSICGASKLKIFAIYIAEIFTTLLLSFIVGWSVFRFTLIRMFSMIYPSFAEFFTFKIYLMILGIYMGVGLIVMTINIIPIVNRSITDLKEG